MESTSSVPATALFADALHFTLRSVPLTCFTLTLLTDIAYWQTSNLLWLHFSEWLLLAGASVGALALLVTAIDAIFRRRARPSWPAALLGILALVLAAINNFVHTADGWTAVVPWGLALSVATLAAMLLTGWFGARSVRHV